MEYTIIQKMFPSYTPLTLGQTYIDILLPFVEWFLVSKSGKATSKGDLVVGDKVFKKVTADKAGWL